MTAGFTLQVGRRRWMLAPVAAILALPLASGSAIEKLPSLSFDSLRVIAMLQGRSPGERTDANLTSTKRRKAPGRASRILHSDDSERVSTPDIQPIVSDAASPPEQFLGLIAPLAAISGPQGEPSTPPLTDDLLGVGHGGGLGGDSLVLLGGGIGGGRNDGTGLGSTGPTGNSAAPEAGVSSQIPAVPEPETWALMLLGMALCGVSMRRKRRLQLLCTQSSGSS